MRNIRHHIIIHGFAILHILATLLSIVWGIADSRFITPLTLLMITVLCMEDSVRFNISAVLMIIGNLAGYFVGMTLMRDVGHLFNTSPAVNEMIGTFITTELIGWGTVLLSWSTGSRFKVKKTEHSHKHYLLSLLIVLFIIYCFRILINILTTNGVLGKYIIYKYLTHYFNNSILLVIIIVASIFVARTIELKIQSTRGKTLFILASIPCISFIAAFGCQASYARTKDLEFPDWFEFIRYFIVGLLLISGLVALLYTIMLSIQTKHDARNTEYKYLSLRNQLSPHFLINSLNVLNGLIASDRKEDAGQYIYKLTDIYQYHLMTEGKHLIPLSEEITNLHNYIDLLNVRFNNSLKVTIDIKPEDLDKSVVPCSIQLLLENAVKHNAATIRNPLEVSITSNDATIQVSNSLIPRFSKPKSTGVGLSYIKEQYKATTGNNIVIEKDDTCFTVILPLI